MKGSRYILLFGLILVAILYIMQGGGSNGPFNQEVKQHKGKEIVDIRKSFPSQINPITGLPGSIYQWIGKTSTDVEKDLGRPIRKDKSPYGYTWWVYTNQVNEYIQFGVNEDDKIVTVFATGDHLSAEPVAIGQPYDELDKQFKFTKEVSISQDITSYRFELTQHDLETRPLTQIGTNKFAQFYFDVFTNNLSSIRVMTSDVLLRQRPYEIFYRGDLPTDPLLSEQDWQEIDRGMEKQIFDITNIIRSRHEKNILDWEDEVAEVALAHSEDMEDNNYFSHYTQNGEGLKERLKNRNVFYFSAGENIAAQYTDGPAVVEGWLNSEGHREALLNDSYTHLGVGVYRHYYTQNFLEKPDPH
ncbi:CAP domain-containing protein [Aquibacillus sediminis]|uniref:CAP domain-containing protein n=1 Tax=Aquibacillus sediminis TaxID=2574734 RepID=UPI0011091F22|nr:CAP domain-containing protein [Aquibacillus sediminis]